MKRITLILLAAAAIIAGSVSCSKVNDIDKRLTQLEQTVSDLKAQVLAGAVITSVEKTEGGCTFTLSNGQSYVVTNGKDGTDGEAIIADVKIEEDFVVLTLKNGEILRISYQNPLSMVTLRIVPDYNDGTVKEPKTTEAMGKKSTHFYLDVAVTPAKYAEILADTERFIHKAVFSPVKTKSDFGNAFTVSPTSVTYMAGAPVPFLQASFEFDDETAAVLQSSAYTVSYSIEDKDGVHGAATAFVAISNDKGSGGDDPDDNILPEGALPGVFSLSDTKKVHFSKGNLLCEGEEFKFEDNQYSYHGYDSQNNTWGLFGWVGQDGLLTDTITQHGASTSINKADYGVGQYDLLKIEWGFCIDSDTWRTLTASEWDYLFKYRTNASFKNGFARVNNVPGVIILPDSFTDPNTNNGCESFVNQSTMGWDANIYIGADWDTMETNGAVFLPAAGFRYGSEVNFVGEVGKYWSSTSSGNYAFNMTLYDDMIPPAVREPRYHGCSVRLVSDCE